MSNRKMRGMMVVMALAGSTVASANAQDPRMPLKIDAPSRAAIQAILDSAAAQGLPEAPLREKFLEGYSRGIEGPKIVAVVRALAVDMAIAHRQLGALASSDEIKAAASAVHAGVPAVELGKIKKQGGLRHSLTLPFTVLTDIVTRGVPVGAAVNAVKSMVGAGAKDKEITDFQRGVAGDIDKGAPPEAAAETRAKSATPEKKPEKPEGSQIDG
ncbi:MAG: hypothetical protein V4550_09340 [Gemmatimonadota bacterium]